MILRITWNTALLETVNPTESYFGYLLLYLWALSWFKHFGPLCIDYKQMCLIYIYIYREREREKKKGSCKCLWFWYQMYLGHYLRILRMRGTDVCCHSVRCLWVGKQEVLADATAMGLGEFRQDSSTKTGIRKQLVFMKHICWLMRL